MDQLIEFARHPSSEGVHHEVHAFFHHLHLMTMCGGAVSAVDGRLVSCHSCLLRALLPSSLS